MRFVPFALRCLILAGLTGLPFALKAQTVAPFYAGSYNIQSLGPVPDLPFTYGGLAFKAGDTNTLLIGGDANQPQANIYAIGVLRDANKHITNFTGSVAYFASAYGLTNSPGQGGIDGGLAYGPSNVLFYTSYKDNGLSQIRTGETNPIAQTDLTALGVAPSVGALVFVPQGFPGAGKLKLLSVDASIWYDSILSPAADGTFKIAASTNSPVDLNGVGPEGAVYVAAGNPGFTTNSIVLSEFAGDVATYVVDSNGDPIISTRKPFVTGVQSLEGAAIDPVTGDFLFTTSGSNPQVFVVGGFTINPSDIPPTVRVTSPTSGQSLKEPADITLAATATDSDGTVKLVEYFNNGALLGSSSNAPYHVDWKGLAAGAYSVIAKATDNQGAVSYSDPVTFTVAGAGVPPTVTLVALSKTNFTACTDLPLSANAQDSDGQVTKVEFQANGVTVGTSTSSPFSIVWRNLQAGSFTLTAKATDNTGLSTTSAGIQIKVAALPLDKLIGSLETNKNFLICIGSDTNRTYGIDASTNLLTWIRLTNIVSGTNTGLQFEDTDASKYKARFYRAQKQ